MGRSVELSMEHPRENRQKTRAETDMQKVVGADAEDQFLPNVHDVVLVLDNRS